MNEAPRAGAVEPALAAEFPGLGVLAVTVPGSPVRSSEGVRERLRRLSDGFRGADAVALRSRPVPQAYRGFFRGVGLDPDAERTPVEALVLERMLTGAWAPRDAVSDAVRIAIVETGVAVLALDADSVAGVPGVRQAAAGEPLDGAPLPAGRLVLADARVAVAALFGPVAAACAVHRGTTSVLLVAVVVPGVPALFAEEALWVAGEVVASSGP